MNFLGFDLDTLWTGIGIFLLSFFIAFFVSLGSHIISTFKKDKKL